MALFTLPTRVYSADLLDLIRTDGIDVHALTQCESYCLFSTALASTPDPNIASAATATEKMLELPNILTSGIRQKQIYQIRRNRACARSG